MRKVFLDRRRARAILSFMAKFSAELDRAFAALADPTRRAIVGRLCDGPRSVSELAEPFDLALPSLLKHVRVLEQSGLISSEKVGRVRTCRIESQALKLQNTQLELSIKEAHSRLDATNKELRTERALVNLLFILLFILNQTSHIFL